MKSGIILTDTHCGSQWGLTPPDWLSKGAQIKKMQGDLWDWFFHEVQHIGDVDVLIANGDMVDGEGKKDNKEHITTDMGEQIEMASEVCFAVRAKNRFVVRGTPYHVDGPMKYEDALASEIGGKAVDTLYLSIGGVKFQFRHVLGRSDTPYGQATQIFKEYIRTVLNSVINKSEKPDVTVRSHVHYWFDVNSKIGRSISTPCMEYPFGSYGRKLRTMYYDMGFLYFEIDDSGRLDVYERLVPLELYNTTEYVYV